MAVLLRHPQETADIVKGKVTDDFDREFPVAIPFSWFKEKSSEYSITWYNATPPAGAYFSDTENFFSQVHELIRRECQGGSVNFDYLSL